MHNAIRLPSSGALAVVLFLMLGNDVVRAEPQTKPTDGPLLWAVVRHQPDEALKLIAGGADLEAHDELGSTPLYFAAAHPSADMLDVTKALVAAGAKINARGRGGDTPLHAACETGRAETTLFLIGKGAEVNAVDKLGCTPLHIASGRDAQPVPDVDVTRQVRALLEHGAIVNVLAKDGTTPLDVAMTYHRRDIAEILIAHGGRHGTAMTSQPSAETKRSD